MVLLLAGEPCFYRTRKPVLPRRPAFLDPSAACFGDRQDRLPPIIWIGCSPHKPSCVQGRDDGSHRLRSHSLGSGQARCRHRTVFLKTKKHRCLRRRQISHVSLIAQSTPELTHDATQVLRDSGGNSGLRSIRLVVHTLNLAYRKLNYKGNLLIWNQARHLRRIPEPCSATLKRQGRPRWGGHRSNTWISIAGRPIRQRCERSKSRRSGRRRCARSGRDRRLPP